MRILFHCIPDPAIKGCGHKEWLTVTNYDELPWTCPKCGIPTGPWNFRELTAYERKKMIKQDYDGEITCNDARCRTSTSLKCRCSCGGALHGIDAFA